MLIPPRGVRSRSHDEKMQLLHFIHFRVFPSDVIPFQIELRRFDTFLRVLNLEKTCWVIQYDTYSTTICIMKFDISIVVFLCWTGQWQAAAGGVALEEVTASLQSWLGMLDLEDSIDRISLPLLLPAIVCHLPS